MFPSSQDHEGYLSPADLVRIEALVKDVCKETPDGAREHAEAVAVVALEMYQSGIRDLETIRARVRMI